MGTTFQATRLENRKGRLAAQIFSACFLMARVPARFFRRDTSPLLRTFFRLWLMRLFMTSISQTLLRQLTDADQIHVIRWWDQLSDVQKHNLLNQLQQTDLSVIRSMWAAATTSAEHAATDGSRAERATAPAQVVRQPSSESDRLLWKQADKLGCQLLSAGKVGVITVAGGQGTRLGFEHPKGMFPIGPVTDRTLFQIFAEQILARRTRHGSEILWMIMTSDATHDETIAFFRGANYFGLNQDTVCFFRQGCFPAVDAATGRILMSDPGTLCLSPDGHGGLVAALKASGLLQRMLDTGVEHLFYHQVDNPAVIVCNPSLLGFHSQRNSQVTTCVVKKVSPAERMGVLVDVGSRTEIIEYSELTPEQSARHDKSGQWIFWAGNTAVHVFSTEFLNQLTVHGGELPLHIASKNVPFVNDHGQLVTPDDPKCPNALKFERFIFDAIPLAARTLIVEGNRDREFHPVKNRDGADSPATARAAMSKIASAWLRDGGAAVADDEIIEISPLLALDAEEAAERLRAGVEIAKRRTEI
jgi:UDP-N-acetylglucosamine/UDP-N-acetylgalactosamine diphosphorylase